jgi:hypothetical protein
VIERNFVCNRTVEAFLKDDTSQVKLLFGCVGSGKSSACDIHLYMLARSLAPGHDGIRRSRWAVIRSTYSQLKTTTIKTWQEWFPPEVFGDIKGDSPMTHHIKHDDVDMEIIFLALDSLADLNRLKSLELTGAYINEAQFVLNPDIVSTVMERTMRYPGKIFGGGLGRPLVIMDCNPPSTRHWIYHMFERERADGWAIYKMPPALIKDALGDWVINPNADFVHQVPSPDYWLRLARGVTDEYIRVSLCGEYGVLEDGRAVHPEYNDSLHFTPKLSLYDSNLEVGLGWDFGNTPACAVVQMRPDGQLVVLHEFWTEYMALRPFAENVVIPQMDKKFPGWRSKYISRHDPAGQSMGSDGKTCQSILRELGIVSMPAASQAPTYRRDALKYFLTRMSNGQPGFLLTGDCHMLREGLMGAFKYEVIKSTLMMASKEFHEKPLKNIYSHICEGLEYICSEYARVTKPNSRDEDKALVNEMASHFRRSSTVRKNVWQQR